MTLRADYAPEGAERPGQFPFTRGVTDQPGPWIMGQYAGFGSAADTNQRFRELLDAGQTGFSVALDLPTQLGLDSDDHLALGEVGKVGVAIDSLADIEILMRDIPLEQISQVRTTANSIGYLWAAMFVALAEQRGVDPNEFGLFIQNDVLKEFIARGTQIFEPEPSLSLAVDVIEYCAREVPNWVPLAISGYHIRESGSDAVQEIAFTFANAIAYLDAAIARGLSVDQFAPSLFAFLSSGIEILEEVAKFRAARRVWAHLLRDRYGAKDPKSSQLRIFAFTAGSSLTAQQPLNNISRTTVEGLAAALGGVQTLHVCAYDEALGTPTSDAATVALRTQQILCFETGVTETLDPFAGSYAVEALTDELAAQVLGVMDRIDQRGGSIACISSGWFQNELNEAAYRQARNVETGETTVVGVNRFTSEPIALPAFEIDPRTEQAQRDALSTLRARRDSDAVKTALDHITAAVRGNENVMDACIEAVKAYATVGEIIGRIRDIVGAWRPTRAL
ncbi:MAG: methylmalonyl-CoA mutase family protein [Acidimicrobiia bacterium]